MYSIFTIMQINFCPVFNMQRLDDILEKTEYTDDEWLSSKICESLPVAASQLDLPNRSAFGFQKEKRPLNKSN